MSWITYPRAQVRDSDELPPGAYENIPPSIRDGVRKAMALRFRVFRWNLSERYGDGIRRALIPAYPDPSTLSSREGMGRRADEVGLNYPEPGAVKGYPPVVEGAFTWQIGEQSAWAQRDLEMAFKGDNAQSEALRAAFSDTRMQVVTADQLETDAILWRFVGAHFEMKTPAGEIRAIDLCQYANGSWWGVGQLPNTEAQWRDEWAIPGHWNGDGMYAAVRLSDLSDSARHLIATHGLIGHAGPQVSMTPGYYLRGGGRQLYIPPKAGAVLVSPGQENAFLRRSSWNGGDD